MGRVGIRGSTQGENASHRGTVCILGGERGIGGEMRMVHVERAALRARVGDSSRLDAGVVVWGGIPARCDNNYQKAKHIVGGKRSGIGGVGVAG